MSKQRDDTVYLKHILECIAEVHNHSSGILARLHEHSAPWDATLRRLQIMAESTVHLSDAVKSGAPHIPWHKIKGFRNILVHDYLGDVDPAIVRGVVETYLPPLKEFCEQCLKKTEEKHDK
jgi:uncharacterized protein with HEPN domain